MVDRRDREFVFVGVIGGHPHCGTAHFSYDNSDGSGPNLFDDEDNDEDEEVEACEEEEDADAAAEDPTTETKKDRVEAPSAEQRMAAGTAFVVTRLLPAAKLRFREFCHNMWH
jgi:predicted  nucleic acid-binding Zn-ribbon protein